MTGVGEAESNKWVVAGTVMTGTIMAVLDSSIVNVALPDMTATLGATVEQITWVVSGYLLSSVILMPITALLSARFGRKRFYLASVILFTVSSMACGMARSLPVMVLFRVLQGVGGGVLITVSQAILREAFPAEEQGMAMGLYGMGVVLAPAIGPTLGGWITDQYTWPWVFYINIPIGVLNVLLVTRNIEDPPYLVRDTGKIDFLGVGLLTVGLGALQLMLESGEREDWFESTMITALAVVATVGLACFVWRELVADRPAVDLRILKNGAFTSATALGGVLGMGLFGTLFLLPLFLQRLLGYSAMDSGLALMPRSLAMAVLMPVAGRLYNAVGPRTLVGAGLAVSAYSFWDLGRLSLDVGFWDIFFPQLWQGVGFSLIFVALSTAALAQIERPKMTAATGLYNVVRQVFGSVGIALAATELTRGQARFHAILAAHVTPFDATSQHWMAMVTAGMRAAGVDGWTASRRALRLLDLEIGRQAAVLAYNRIFMLVAVLFLLAVPMVLFLSRGSREAGPIEVVGEG
ncbi:MAG TPA: DHA2 family efflux MFS transporter permease subunit [Longimicrobiales bacterium]